MKSPGWLVMEGKMRSSDEPGVAIQDVRIRVWHPSILPELWALLPVHWPLKPFVVGWLWLRLLWRYARP